MINDFDSMISSSLIAYINELMPEVATLKKISNEKLYEELAFKALMDYLGDPQQQNSPTQFQLAPHQLGENPPGEALKYFRKVTCLEINSTTQHIRDNFIKLYPSVARTLINEKIVQSVQKEKLKPDPYAQILQKLKQSVVGQDQAATLLATALKKQKEGNHVFIFVGPTGVGKTALAKAAAEYKRKYIFFPMNQYQSEYTVSNFFGSGAGILGSDDKPFFAKELDKCKPTLLSSDESTEQYEVENILILLDEFEKAHSKVKQSLLTIFDVGMYKGQYTKRINDRENKNVSIIYSLKNCIIINTSNLYQDCILRAFQQKMNIEKICELFRKQNQLYPEGNSYSPELLSRMDVIPFGPIPSGNCYHQILKNNLNFYFEELKKEFSFKEIIVENEAKVLLALEKKFYGNGTNIRKLAQHFAKFTVFM
ncbi:AAA family ATPase [Neochlamydia sp. AcF95]|uniref:AAA family ATPase n=1 Tax=Neochlamydia sp. AcF95 TaxID=2795734 RepID=UPI001BC9DDCD|nr:AAA family ATPase [Neochlamydia sp. AcF95]MBS4171399.1 hypothetical protein [Neochlamydia sp. AcF95]